MHFYFGEYNELMLNKFNHVQQFDLIERTNDTDYYLESHY